jgi:CRP/FNR family transcriptional regulator
MNAETKDRAELLKRVALFADLSEKEIAFVAEHSYVRRFGAGEIIFSEGDPCTGLFVIQSGAVKIFKIAPNGREQVLSAERAGSSIAELPVFDGGTYPASALAAEECDLILIRKEDLRALCLQHPEVALKLLKVVGKRLRTLVGIIEELSFTTVRQRVLTYLVRLASEAGGGKKAIEVTLPVSHQELAAELGTVRELISRNLSRLQAEGLIRMQARIVLIPDLAMLRAALEPGA